MSVMRRAWLSICRQRNKSLILFGIVFLLGNVIAGSYAMLQGTRNVEAIIKKQLAPIISLELDNAKWTEAIDKKTIADRLPPMIPAEEIQLIGQLPYVKSYDFSYSLSVLSDDLRPWSSSSQTNPQITEFSTGSFQLIGTEYAPIMAIEEQKATLVSGRTFTQSEIDQGQTVALISQELAELNQVNEGQNIRMTNEILFWNDITSGWEVIENRPVILKVIGIIDYPMKDDHFNNQLIVPNRVLDDEHRAGIEVLLEKSKTEYTDIELKRLMIPNYRSLFLLKDSSEVDQFVKEVEPLLPPFHTIKTTSDIYTRVAGPLEQADKIAKHVFFVGIGASVVILMLVTILFLRDRKHEIAIFLSLGEKCSHIISQILLEIFLLAIVAVSLSLLTGNALTGVLSEDMIQDRLIQEAQSGQVIGDPWGDNYSFGVFSSTVSADDLGSHYRISLTPQYVGLVFLISIATIALAGIAPSVYIMRLNPKQIMMQAVA